MTDPRERATDPLERATRRYLDVVKAALLDEHYLDNELRIDYLAASPPGEPADVALLRDPPRQLAYRYEQLVRARRAGRTTDGIRNVAYFPYTDMGRAAIDHLERSLDGLRTEGVPGDLAEFGVGRGGGAIFMRAWLEAHEIPDTRVFLVDRFLGSDPDTNADPPNVASALWRFRADLHQVTDGFARFDLLDDRVRLLQGVPQDVLVDAPIDRLALVRLGPALGGTLKPVLDRVQQYLSPGAVIIVEGTAAADIEQIVHEIRERHGVTSTLERVGWNAMTWRLPAEGPAAGAAATPAPPVTGTALHRSAPVPARPADAVDLSVVVVFYNMRREAARTLLSLSRAYQRDVADLDYEVIVVENGSAPEQRLGDEFVRSFGPEFRYVDLGAGAPPSPTVALNRGAAEARGAAVAFMIDGAHVLTPGVLHLGTTAMQTFAPAVVAIQQWYLGPGQQGDSLHAGYDQKAEDQLFGRIRWPVDGYRLFEIGHFIGERDWFDGIVESNCVFIPRDLLEQLGAFDDSFSMPGGGYANLELFERLGLTPGVNVVSLLGEGTFHQVHGGTTTNIADASARRDLVSSYGAHFEELRGRSLLGVSKPVHYLGSMPTKAMRRTRSRRDISVSFNPQRDPVDDEFSQPAVQVPDEVKFAAIEAVWASRTWRETKWLGHPVLRYPTDLYSYQEIVSEIRPDFVVVAGDDEGLGGRALFFASIMDALEHGRVVAVGERPAGARPVHPRIMHVVGPAEAPEVAAQVRAHTGEEPRAVVFLGLGAVARVAAAFEQYAPLVPVGSYVVIENTIVNGRPVASAFGPGPFEAAVDVLRRHREFFTDPTYERYTLTFNRNGYLRRMGPTP